jgi:hypothetical protein
VKPYQDIDTFYHHKPVVNGDPSSNNGYIYTAYSKYLAPNTLDRHRIIARFVKCTKSLDPVKITRLPGMETPPLSKDEIIGMVSLGLISDSELSRSHYNFCSQDIAFERKLSLKSIFGAVKALFKIRKEHRNYVWENRIVEAYPLAFRLPPEDIYYVQKYSGVSPSLLNTTIFYANMAMVWAKGDKSSRMMLFLKLNDLGHPFRKLIPYKKWVRDYFPADHPFVRFLK